MNTLKSIFRIITLIVLGLAGLIIMLDSMRDASEWRLLLHVIIDLPIAALLLYIFHRLYKRWVMTDKWIKAYNRWVQPE